MLVLAVGAILVAFLASTTNISYLVSAGLEPMIDHNHHHHFQHHQPPGNVLFEQRQDGVFLAQNGDSTGLGNNYQLDLTGDLPPTSQHDNHEVNQHQPADQSADYYYPEQQTPPNNHNNANNFPSETFDTPMLSNFNHNNQRLPEKEYLNHNLAEKACRLDRGCQRKDRLNNTYLNYCTRYKLENLFSNEILMSIMHDSIEECDKILDEFIQLDELINQFDQYFKKLLTRYNCHNGYSVKWSCEDCKKAYKDWLCATNLPYYMNGERIKPCISFCERVEQRCPYLHPITKEQYGGQPVFICRDPNIPFVPEITPDIPYSEPAKCYDLCHLSDNNTELLIDSLSKYDPDKCPSKGSIAEEVRSDPLYCRLDLEQQPNNGSKIHQNTDQYDPTSLAEFPIENHETTTTSFNGTIDGEHKPVSTKVHVHIKKLEELREVLTVNDRSIDHAKHWSTPRSHHSPARARRFASLEPTNRRLAGKTTNTAERCDRCFAQ